MVQEIIPKGYKVVELDQRVSSVSPIVLKTRFKRRADSLCRKLNGRRQVVSYRYEVEKLVTGKWAVVVMQNQLQRM